MKRTRTFTLIMAIVWTVVGGLAILLVANSGGLNSAMNALLVLLAFVAIAGNWLRWFRSR